MSAPSPSFARCRPVREERLDDALFLIDQEGQAIHMLDGIGVGLWTLLAEPITVPEAKQLVRDAFPGVPAKRIARDVVALFDELEDAGLIAHDA